MSSKLNLFCFDTGTLEKVNLCIGVEDKTKNTKVHQILAWSEDHLRPEKSYVRSPDCKVIGKTLGFSTLTFEATKSPLIFQWGKRIQCVSVA